MSDQPITTTYNSIGLDKFLEEKIQEAKRWVENWEVSIKKKDYLKWSGSTTEF